ncbi:MAG TPA: universal stress protein [Roseateles sp.]|uniref:universal stress protein n=1 Tax=Roseateles sp. TaxID=1971397 RepID=UPI002ED845C5
MGEARRHDIPEGLACTVAAQPSQAEPMGSVPHLAGRVILVVTSPGAEESDYLEKVAALAQFSGARLRLVDCSSRVPSFDLPLARLKQRARHLGRMLDRSVETVDAEIRTQEELRQQVEACALVCIARSARAWRSGPRERDLLRALIALRIRPVLVMGHGKLRGYGGYASSLVPVSLGPHSPELLSWARAMAPLAALDVLHVTEIREHTRRRSWAALLQRLRQLAEGVDESSRGVTHTLAHGVVPDVIGRRHVGERHELVVVGIGLRKRWLPWPTLAQYLARWLNGDVLVIPQSHEKENTPFKGQWGFWT